MEVANRTPLRPLPPGAVQAGVACLARYTRDHTVYRAVVLKRDSTTAKVYYLDYGNSEQVQCLLSTVNSLHGGPAQVPLERVYGIPAAQLATQMLSVRCSVYQWPQLAEVDRARARQLLERHTGRALQCRVVR